MGSDERADRVNGVVTRSSLWCTCLILGALAGVACEGTVEDAVPGDNAVAMSDAGADDADAGDATDPPQQENDAQVADAGLDPEADGGGDAAAEGCGDGKIQPDEACDDANSSAGDGCSADCRAVDRDFVCPAPGEACVSSVSCGDGRISGAETCDDENARGGDGCSADCGVEPGYVCSLAGTPCSAARCGDGIVAGDEQCEDDDAPPAGGDGCSAECRLESGHVCPTAGASCVATTCNDGKREGSEPCDDGNAVIGDGCTPFCEVEPDCTAGACRSRCGDGLMLPSDREDCDDGNTLDGDGCSKDCKVEAGYTCELEQAMLPEVLAVPVVYRDFISFPAAGAVRHPDYEVFIGGDVTVGLVESNLGEQGKPAYTGICDDSEAPYPQDDPPRAGSCPWGQQTTAQANFDQWYRDVPGVNVSRVGRLMLPRDAASGAYAIQVADYFPWDGDPGSWVGMGREQLQDGHNFGFTSEIRTYFEYRGTPQTLRFLGDDDVWVFINHKLAVDIGGVHVEQERSVTLDAARASELSLEVGKIYEIALFHAERATGGSHFNLTLDGFASARSVCLPRCGDGVVTSDERCDDGKNDGSYGSCTSSCQRAGHCGDGVVEDGREECDDGVNLTTYSTSGEAGCAPGCKRSAFCGDDHVDSMAGEQCDDGDNDGGYGQCARDCRLGERCGDGEVQSPAEECDDGNRLGNDGCSSDCKDEGPA